MSELEKLQNTDRQLLNESIASLKEYLPKLVDGIEKVLQHLAEQSEGEAFALLAKVIEGLQWTVEMVVLTKPTLERMGISVDEAQILGILQELMSAMENHDLVLLADLLEYEILEFLYQWQKSLMQKLN